MTHLDILRYQRELRLCNINDVSDRLLEATNGNVFVCYNVLKDAYELHAVSSFRYTGVSYNTNIPFEMLNGNLIQDYKLRNHRKYADQEADRRYYSHALAEQHENKNFEEFSRRGMRMVERTLGRTL